VGDFANEPLTREERRRLTGVIVSLMIGATLGALLLLHLPVYAPLLPLMITLGVVVMAATSFAAAGT
jgi:CHASE2 domain-containing sensor protein